MAAFLWISFATLLISFSARAQSGLEAGFYSSSCPKAEDIVRSTVEKYFNKDTSIAAGLLRLHFHDCFVQVLLLRGQNSGLRGFEVVDDTKSQLEAACPGVVSCANILALAARDAVDLSGGPSW